MKKFIFVAVLAGFLASAGTAYALAGFSPKFPRAVLYGAVAKPGGGEQGIYKFTDGNTTCYIVNHSVSCVR